MTKKGYKIIECIRDLTPAIVFIILTLVEVHLHGYGIIAYTLSFISVIASIQANIKLKNNSQ